MPQQFDRDKNKKRSAMPQHFDRNKRGNTMPFLAHRLRNYWFLGSHTASRTEAAMSAFSQVDSEQKGTVGGLHGQGCCVSGI
jgi:hypothetical protein